MLTSVPDESVCERLSTDTAGDLFPYTRRLVGAVEPAIVFSSLAGLCVPGFSDLCSVDIVEGGRVRYRIAAPHTGGDPATSSGSTGADPQVAEVFKLRTTFDSALDGWASYTGVMVHSWFDYLPTAEDEERAARLVGHAIRVIADERRDDPMRRPGIGPASSTFRRARGHC